MCRDSPQLQSAPRFLQPQIRCIVSADEIIEFSNDKERKDNPRDRQEKQSEKQNDADDSV